MYSTVAIHTPGFEPLSTVVAQKHYLSLLSFFLSVWFRVPREILSLLTEESRDPPQWKKQRTPFQPGQPGEAVTKKRHPVGWLECPSPGLPNNNEGPTPTLPT